MLVATHQEQLDHDPVQHERALPGKSLAGDPVEREDIDAIPRLRRVEQIHIDVVARRNEPAQLLTPPAEHPRLDPAHQQQRLDALDKCEVVHAVWAISSSRGRRRETICDTPSGPIVTP